MRILLGRLFNFKRGNCMRLMPSNNGALEKRMPILLKRIPFHSHVLGNGCPRMALESKNGCPVFS